MANQAVKKSSIDSVKVSAKTPLRLNAKNKDKLFELINSRPRNQTVQSRVTDILNAEEKLNHQIEVTAKYRKDNMSLQVDNQKKTALNELLEQDLERAHKDKRVNSLIALLVGGVAVNLLWTIFG
ncbi:hypothetical protein I3271_05580 [Photobacterium leiognathi]|uniref:hypothetical protein n=1 Tax=Photobacterium leiognathi TaxID=553611 RepID=UPI001EE07CF7|nr:hypothetical protein [Photobacterium leiognathi]MCG3884152.1 hypothetical protein [Photobacterium leiognathi]